MSSSVRIRLNFADPDHTSSWIPLVGGEAGKQQSYFVCRDGDHGLKIDTVDDESSGYDRPMVLAAIHISEDSDVSVEAIYSLKEAPFITRDLSSPIKRRIQLSHPPKVHKFWGLDYSCFLCVDGEKIQLDLGDSPISTTRALPSSVDRIDKEGDISMGIDDDPHIQVEQSMQDPVVTTVNHGVGYRDSTPVIPETNPEETIITETPVKSRFFNPMSSGRTPKAQDSYTSMGNDSLPPGNQSAEVKLATALPKSGLIFAGYDDGKADEGMTSQSPIFADPELSTSEEENEAPRYLVSRSKGKRPKSTSLESDIIVARLGEEISEERGLVATGSAPSNLTPLGEPDGEKENHPRSPSSLESPIVPDARKPSMDDSAEMTERASKKEHRIHTAKTTESLPEAFLYEEHMKSTTPGRTYSKKGLTRSPLSAKKSPEQSPTDRKHGDQSDGNADKNVSTPLHQKKRKAFESPSEVVASEEEGRGGNALGKDTNKRRKAGPELQNIPAKGTVDNQTTIAPARRGFRGRKIVQSQPEDSGGEVQGAALGSPPQGEGPQVQQQPQEPQDGESSVPGKEAELTAPAKTPKRKSRKKPSDEELSVGVVPEELPAVVGHRESQEHAGAPGGGRSSREITEEPEARKPKPKHANQPATRKGAITRRSLAVSPPVEIPREGGDTQYTVPSDTQTQTQTQTQTLDRVEIKTPKSIGKKSTAKPKKTPLRKRGASSRNASEEVSLNGEQGPSQGDGLSISIRTRERYGGDAPRIVFSNSGLDGRKDIEKFLRTASAKKMDNVSAPGVNFLVVGPGELKRTPKLTISVALGKTVVEDQWLIDSKEIGYFLNPEPYIPNDPLHEKEWGFNLAAAVKRGRQGENSVLKGWNVNITLALVSQLKAGKQEESLVEMLRAAGAGNIAKKAPKGIKKDGEQTLVLGSEKGDNEVNTLVKSGWAVFSTGIIALSVLRGKLDTDTDEFLIKSDDVGSGATGQTQRPRRRAK